MLVFTDLHGCKRTFFALLKQAQREYPDDKIVVAGDVMDRGPDSRGIIEYLIENKIDYVLGNHDKMMLDYHGRYRDDWGHNGGLKTMKQYNDDIHDQKFLDHKDWLKEQPYIREYPEVQRADGRWLIVTHSGITDTNLIQGIHDRHPYAVESIIWNRQDPIDLVYAFNVYGHTPTPEPIITKHSANIDTGGCYWKPEPPLIFGAKPGPRLGKLTCLQFPDMKIFQQENIEWEMRPEYNEATL